MQAVIKQAVGYMVQQLNPKAFEIVLYDDDGNEVETLIVNRVKVYVGSQLNPKAIELVLYDNDNVETLIVDSFGVELNFAD